MSQVEVFEKLFAEYIGVRHAVAVNSGSSALLASLNYLRQEEHVEYVITTPYTFKATSNAVLLTGLTPVFVDIEPEGYGLDPVMVKQALKEYAPRKMAILPVHLFGVPCNMKKLLDLSIVYEAPIVEDSSQALGAELDGVKCGAMGLMGTFSFYATKNLSTFQGGMITTNVFHVDLWLRKFRNHGAIRNDRPMHILGMNLAMPEILAFIGQTQLRLHKIGIEAELETYGPDNGYYPKLVFEEAWYQQNQGRWLKPYDTPNADRAVKHVQEIQK